MIANHCWNDFGTPFAQLLCYFSNNLSSYVPEYGDRDYVVPIFNFNTTADVLEDLFGLLGFADDNWIDGTQSLVFTFGAGEYRSFGYGFTGTVIHEVGHHIGMSHPHDEYDSEFDFDYGPSGALYFAWEGDESDVVMHYLSLTNRYGEHNRCQWTDGVAVIASRSTSAVRGSGWTSILVLRTERRSAIALRATHHRLLDRIHGRGARNAPQEAPVTIGMEGELSPSGFRNDAEAGRWRRIEDSAPGVAAETRVGPHSSARLDDPHFLRSDTKSARGFCLHASLHFQLRKFVPLAHRRRRRADRNDCNHCHRTRHRGNP